MERKTIFLNIDAKSIFLEEKSKSSYTLTSENDLDKSPIQSSEVVVTIRQHESEIVNQDVTDETEESIISTATTKKPCTQETKEERLICQKAKEAAKQKQTRVSGSNPAKSSTIQTPTP